MNRLKIRNVGPIKNIDFELKKINVFMGPQSSGKSTIAKIISYCQWVEKRRILDGSFQKHFVSQLSSFHRISKEYFSDNSEIKYESDFIIILYKNCEATIEPKKNIRDYKKPKNLYIPAERNFVSVIPNLGKFKETNDNIMSFLFDWYDVKSKYRKESLEILNLDVEYRHVEKNDLDILELKNIGKEIQLLNSSSGLQSVVPLIILFDYLTKGLYKEKQTKSFTEKSELKKVISIYLNEILENENLKDLEKKSKTFQQKELKKLQKFFLLRSNYFFSRIIIEEPEQNLFPRTQRDLIYFLMKQLNESVENHELILTTHSPYVLYALNNCLLGFTVKNSVPQDIKKELISSDSWIDPSSVGVWEIKEGIIESIQDEKLGTISDHYFNQVMNEVMDEYYEMLNHLKL